MRTLNKLANCVKNTWPGGLALPRRLAKYGGMAEGVSRQDAKIAKKERKETNQAMCHTWRSSLAHFAPLREIRYSERRQSREEREQRL
jgi:hypothetical protein